MAHAHWIENAFCPAHLKDGRDVLVWDGQRVHVAYWDRFEDAFAWATDEGGRITGKKVAELRGPDGEPIDRS